MDLIQAGDVDVRLGWKTGVVDLHAGVVDLQPGVVDFHAGVVGVQRE